MDMVAVILLQWKQNIITCIGVLFTASIVFLKALWTYYVSQMERVIRVESSWDLMSKQIHKFWLKWILQFKMTPPGNVFR